MEWEKQRRLLRTIELAAGGSFRIAREALVIEQRRVGYGRPLSLDSVLMAIRRIRQRESLSSGPVIASSNWKQETQVNWDAFWDGFASACSSRVAVIALVMTTAAVAGMVLL